MYSYWDAGLLTLYFWILGHEEKSPSQSGSCCVSASTKQIEDSVYQTFIGEVTHAARFLQVKIRSVMLLSRLHLASNNTAVEM